MSNSESVPLVSIVIPTRNREFYCIETIKNILNYEYNLELVVHDNSDSDQVEEYILSNVDRRVVYRHIKGRINSGLNMDMALSMASGKYVIMIGDDDTILPNIFHVVDWAIENNYKAISPKFQNAFFWNSDTKSLNKGTFVLYPQKNKYCQYNPKIQLRKLLKNGFVDYQDFFLPRVYHGLIRKDVLQEMRDKLGGKLVVGLSPDICLAVASSLVLDQYIVIDYPISISGVCPTSTSYASKNGGHIGRLEDAPHLYNRADYKWNSNIPALYSVETIWAESALKVLTIISSEPSLWLKFFNRSFFLLVFEKRNKQLLKELPNMPLERVSNRFSCEFKYLMMKMKIIVSAIIRRIRGRRTFPNVQSWDGVNSIYNRMYNRC